MKKIIQFLSSIAKDRWMHYAIGMTAALWLLALGCLISPNVGVVASVVGCVALAFGKEWYDRREGRVFDVVDFIATVAGGMQVWAVACTVLFKHLS